MLVLPSHIFTVVARYNAPQLDDDDGRRETDLQPTSTGKPTDRDHRSDNNLKTPDNDSYFASNNDLDCGFCPDDDLPSGGVADRHTWWDRQIREDLTPDAVQP